MSVSILPSYPVVLGSEVAKRFDEASLYLVHLPIRTRRRGQRSEQSLGQAFGPFSYLGKCSLNIRCHWSDAAHRAFQLFKVFIGRSAGKLAAVAQVKRAILCEAQDLVNFARVQSIVGSCSGDKQDQAWRNVTIQKCVGVLGRLTPAARFWREFGRFTGRQSCTEPRCRIFNFTIIADQANDAVKPEHPRRFSLMAERIEVLLTASDIDGAHGDAPLRDVAVAVFILDHPEKGFECVADCRGGRFVMVVCSISTDDGCHFALRREDRRRRVCFSGCGAIEPVQKLHPVILPCNPKQVYWLGTLPPTEKDVA